MPLTLAVQGEEYVIRRIDGSAEIRAHLQNLGFVPGGIIKVITSMGGNLIVGVMGTRIGVSKEMAMLIMV